MRNWLSTIRVSSTAKVGAEIAGIAQIPVRTGTGSISAIPAISAVGSGAGTSVETIDEGVAADRMRMPQAPRDDHWSAEDWQVFFDERAGIAEFDGGLSRPEAEAQARACCMEEQMARKQRSRSTS